MPQKRPASATDTGGHARARCRAARHVLVEPDEVGETRREPAEPDLEVGRGMPLDHRRRRRCPTAGRRRRGPRRRRPWGSPPRHPRSSSPGPAAAGPRARRPAWKGRCRPRARCGVRARSRPARAGRRRRPGRAAPAANVHPSRGVRRRGRPGCPRGGSACQPVPTAVSGARAYDSSCTSGRTPPQHMVGLSTTDRAFILPVR